MRSSSPSPTRGFIGVGLMFFSNGAILASVLPWYPSWMQRLDLDTAQFGLVVASFAVGALASAPAPAPLITALGPTRVAVLGTLLLAIATAAAPWAGHGLLLAAALFCAGLLDAIVDVAQNVAGIRVEATTGRSILSSMHAMWSLGAVAGGTGSTAAAAAGLDARLYLALAATVTVLAVAAGAMLLNNQLATLNTQTSFRRVTADTSATPTSQSKMGLGTWRPVAIASLPLAIIAICGTTVEDVANNWAALSAVQLGGAEVSIAGLAYTIMIGSQCVGRFTGDPLINRYGRSRIARIGGLLIALGGLAVIAADSHMWLLLLGFSLAGYGSATLVPSALVAAGKLQGVSESAGVALVSWLMRLGFLATSPIIGFLASLFDLRLGLAILIVAGVATLTLSGALAPKSAESRTQPQEYATP